MFENDIELAKKARMNAYSPYNKYTVGACLRCKNGHTYTGCNIDNHGIQCSCAERTALLKAISEGEREFESIVVVGAPLGEEVKSECVPCGYCRQFMREFAGLDFIIITEDNGVIKKYKLSELLPHSYDF